MFQNNSLLLELSCFSVKLNFQFDHFFRVNYTIKQTLKTLTKTPVVKKLTKPQMAAFFLIFSI